MARRRTSVIQVMVTGDARDLNRATQQGSRGLGLLGSAAIAASKLVASSITAIAGFSIREFARFDDAMTKSTAIMGDLTDTMRTDMEQAARQVGKTTSFAAHEAAEAFFFLASAGLDAEQSIAAMPKVAAFAQAGQFDLAQATDLLTDAQSALGLTSEDAAENMENLTRVSDVLVKANTMANASTMEFSQALTERAGAAMRELGVEIETGVAVLGVFADQGIKGSKAGTMLNTTLEGLTRTAQEQSKAYDALGVSVFNSEGEMRNMSSIVGDLEGALEGMSTQQRLAALSSLGLTRQARDGVIQLLGNADAIREYEEALQDAAGTTQEVADKQMESFNEQLGLLGSAFADIGLSIGRALEGPLARFVAWFQEQIPRIDAFVQQVIPLFEEFVDGAVEKFREFKSFYDENLAGPLADLMERLRALAGEGLDFVSEFRDRAEQFLMDFATAVQEADSEEAGTILGEAIGDVIQMGFDRFVDFGKIVGEWAGQQDWVRIGFSLSGHMGRFARGLFMGLTHSLNEETDELEFDGRRVAAIIVTGLVARIPVFRNMVAQRQGIFGIPLIGGILAGIMNASRLLTPGLGLFTRSLLPIISGALLRMFGGTAMAGVFSNIGLTLQRLFAGQFASLPARLVASITGLFSGLGGMLLRHARLLPTHIRQGLIVGFPSLVAWLKTGGLLTMLKGFGALIVGIVASIGGWPIAIFAAVGVAFMEFIRRFRRWNEEKGDEYESFGERIIEFIRDGIAGLKDWFFDNVVGWFRDRFDDVGDWFSDQWQTFKDWGSGIIDGLVQGIKDKAGAVGSALRDAAGNAWESTKDFLRISSPSKLFAEVGEAIGDGLTLGIDDSASGVLRSLGRVSADLAGTEFRAPTVPVAGQAGGDTYVINVQGAIDPEGTARQIERILRDSQRRTGGVFV